MVCFHILKFKNLILYGVVGLYVFKINSDIIQTGINSNRFDVCDFFSPISEDFNRRFLRVLHIDVKKISEIHKQRAHK